MSVPAIEVTNEQLEPLTKESYRQLSLDSDPELLQKMVPGLDNPGIVELCSRTRDKLSPLQAYLIDYLAEINRHPLDSRIKFYEEGHLYEIDGNRVEISCTGIVSRLFPKFDPDKVIMGIRASAAYKNGTSPYSGMSALEIKSSWESAGQEASDLGSEMHSNIEFLMNQCSHPVYRKGHFKFAKSNVSVEMSYFDNFRQVYCPKDLGDPSALIPHRTEWVIFDQELALAGSIDMLFRSYGPLPPDPNRSHPAWAEEKLSKHTFQEGEERYWIFDWKRAKEIKTNFKFKNNKEKYIKLEGSRLENCDYSKYSLQLNIYRYILEKNYGIKIAGMVLVDIHPCHENYLTIEVPFLDQEIEEIMDRYRRSMLERPESGNTGYPSNLFDNQAVNSTVPNNIKNTPKVPKVRSSLAHFKPEKIVLHSSFEAVMGLIGPKSFAPSSGARALVPILK